MEALGEPTLLFYAFDLKDPPSQRICQSHGTTSLTGSSVCSLCMQRRYQLVFKVAPVPSESQSVVGCHSSTSQANSFMAEIQTECGEMAALVSFPAAPTPSFPHLVLIGYYSPTSLQALSWIHVSSCRTLAQQRWVDELVGLGEYLEIFEQYTIYLQSR